jgi:cyclophilin family peptidyl-prolyl cis-trans isomerase
MRKVIISICALVLIFTSLLSAQKGNTTYVLFQTNMGSIKVMLYNETPKHRDNIIKLVATNFYNGLLFHRVMKDFMIQAGDPNSKNAPKDKMLGNGGPGYTIPAEFNSKFYHKKGALAAARTSDEVNPLKASSGSQFYIVQGNRMTDEALNQIEAKLNSTQKNSFVREYLSKPENRKIKEEGAKYQTERNKAKLDSLNTVIMTTIDRLYKSQTEFKFSQQQRNDYKTIGGTPFLDGSYTVFGEVIEGLDVVDKIANVKTLSGNRPENDVIITSAKLFKQ